VWQIPLNSEDITTFLKGIHAQESQMMRKVSDDVEEVKGDVNALNADDVLKSYICNTGNGG